MTLAYQMIKRILVDKFGIVFFDEEQDDFAINDYVTDSVMFMQFIVAIEEEMGEELSDDFLDYDIMSSAKGFAEKLHSFMESLYSNLDDSQKK